MRGFGAFLAGLLAVAAFAVALPFSWLALEIADEDGYVELSRGILDDTETRTALVEAVVDELDGRVRDRFDDLRIPPELIDRTLDELAGYVGQGLASDAVVDGWADSQRQAHQQMFRGDDQGYRFVVDLAPLVASVSTEAGVEVDVTSVPIEITDQEARRAVATAAASPQLAVGAGVVTLVGAVVALALARRRGVALAWLGAAALAVTGVLHLVARVAASADPSAGTDAGTRVGLVLVDVARASFDDLLTKAAVGGGVVLVVGVLLAVAESVRQGRGRTAGP